MPPPGSATPEFRAPTVFQDYVQRPNLRILLNHWCNLSPCACNLILVLLLVKTLWCRFSWDVHFTYLRDTFFDVDLHMHTVRQGSAGQRSSVMFSVFFSFLTFLHISVSLQLCSFFFVYICRFWYCLDQCFMHVIPRETSPVQLVVLSQWVTWRAFRTQRLTARFRGYVSISTLWSAGAGNLRYACRTWHAKACPMARRSSKFYISIIFMIHAGVLTLTCIKIRMLLAYWLIYNLTSAHRKQKVADRHPWNTCIRLSAFRLSLTSSYFVKPNHVSVKQLNKII